MMLSLSVTEIACLYFHTVVNIFKVLYRAFSIQDLNYAIILFAYASAIW